MSSPIPLSRAAIRYCRLRWSRDRGFAFILFASLSGGGIGGLSLAVVLGKHCNDVDISLYEVQPLFTEVGAGISVWKRTWFIMQELGLDVTLGKMATEPPVDEMKPGFCFRKSDQEKEGFNFNQMIVPYGSITLHRADMLKVLTDNLPSSDVFHSHFNKRLVSYTSKANSVLLHFTDGTAAEADMLVGADGIRSAIRSAMYTALADRPEVKEDQKLQLKSYVHASWSGTYAYRSLVETEKINNVFPGHQAASTPMIYLGKSKHVVSYPISQGRFINLILFVTVPGGEGKQLEGPPVVDVPREEMLEQCKGWEPEVMKLTECADKVSKWAISHVRDLPTYVDGLVALLGDSAHAMTTHLGAGAGQAIEDSYILGKLLASRSVTTSNLASILKIYDSIRRPFGNHMVERSRSTGLLYEFDELPEDVDEGRALAGSDIELGKITREVYKKWEIQWTSLPDGEWKEAEQRLKGLVKTSGLNTSKL